ncbi:MAG: dTDP-4-dehydrorhamnose reductase [Anaerolineae bacterium]|nr:dTDP-4-dehydrorhamnose reductase [Anaerolineae bacterium]
MRILLAGHLGQLGRTLMPLLARDHTVEGIDLPAHDITDRAEMLELAARFRPDLILNSAAMTNVDGCARDPGLAYRVNGMGTQNLALAAARVGAEFLQVSTNEVFDGTATEPYHEWGACRPINAYGRSKLAGEWYAQHLLTRFYVVRTAWLYAGEGRNFPHRILELADEHGALSVVTDEVGNPTYVVDLAEAIAKLIKTHAYGIYHLVNDGAASRYEFAQLLLDSSGRGAVSLTPIASNAFQRASTPPAYAPLANTAAAALGIRLRPWQDAVAAFIDAAGYRRRDGDAL